MNQSATIAQFPLPPDNLAFGAVRLSFVRLVPGDPARELVPAFHFHIFLTEGLKAGHLNFRVGDTGHIRLVAGHIGYEIHEPLRGRGYAGQSCQAVAPFVRQFYQTVTITCDPDNNASRRTIEKLGAEFVDEVPIPQHDPHYRRGSRRKLRYLWTP